MCLTSFSLLGSHDRSHITVSIPNFRIYLPHSRKNPLHAHMLGNLCVVLTYGLSKTNVSSPMNLTTRSIKCFSYFLDTLPLSTMLYKPSPSLYMNFSNNVTWRRTGVPKRKFGKIKKTFPDVALASCLHGVSSLSP